MGKGKSLAEEHSCDWKRLGGANVCIGSGRRGHPRDGRIVLGGPHRWKGVHIRDIALVERKRRKILKLDCHREMRRSLRQMGIGHKFKSKIDAARIIYSLNPGWFDQYDPASAVDLALGYLDRKGGAKRWMVEEKGGSNRTLLGKGRTKRALSGKPAPSWSRILPAILPASMAWSEVPRRLEELREVIARDNGGHAAPIDVPAAVYEIDELERQFGDCDAIQQTMITALFDKAINARMRGRAKQYRQEFELSDIPF